VLQQQRCRPGHLLICLCFLLCCVVFCCHQVLGEIRPYLVGTGGGELILDSIDGVIVKIKITGPAANVMTVRVAVTQKLREKIPSIAAVQLL
jgi:Fe-S cluster biogenesis protein NfuA